ncbi:hypothetical protein [Pontibaca salina]|uniref:Uncharacterized protein n=1 Tax=Pontibaca salina TaxID=2795731 RepID=A0A934M0M2_9RHOB|nr:hypothetical protein [Pontibaca salina]MBI6630160.1 hypothetical protein [Pontibaca salina]
MRIGRFRPYFAAVLGLLLVLTSQSLAVARVSPAPVGQMELCTGTGPVMVYFDENGEPSGAPHFCPEGALSLIVALAAPETITQWVGRETRMSGRQDGVAADNRSTSNWRARDPPELV